MSSIRQIEANRRNARLSTGPVTEEGKRRSRQNAVRHGLTAETVIDALEDADDYAAFQLAIASDYDAQSAVERELILRLASLLWRLRRATAIETGLFRLQARQLLRFRNAQRSLWRPGRANDLHTRISQDGATQEAQDSPSAGPQGLSTSKVEAGGQSDGLTGSFVRLTNLPTCPLDRLSRYEVTLWRQACQILLTLQCLSRRSSRRIRLP